MPYFLFTVEDFCRDHAFINWVIRPTPESNHFWQTFMAEHPHKQPDIQMATDYIKTIEFHETNPSEADLARLKERIWSDAYPASEQQAGRVIQWYRRPYWAAAAVLFLVSLLGVAWWQYNADTSYKTAYGKIQEIRLPDGSVVTLNGHSTLRVAKNLTENTVREVWLDGEAYFDIANRHGAKFIVHTTTAQVEVLGTEFNVNCRRQQTHVVLNEGKVQLMADNQPAVLMQPGDMATVTPTKSHIQVKRVQPKTYDAWKESYLVLDGKSLPDIISSLQDTFGVTIQLDDAQLARKKLTGKLRTEVIADCIDNLALILDAEVSRNGTTYSIK